jgi:hypothetical protein
MKHKLTLALCAMAVLGGTVSAAYAAEIPVAIYPFTDPGDAAKFFKVKGTKCSRKPLAGAMNIKLGADTAECAYRSSVIADSTDTSPSVDVSANATYSAKTPTTLKNKLYVGVLTRASANEHYELRVIPAKQRWIVFRDPAGSGGETALKSGAAKFIKVNPAKPNALRLRTFAISGGVSVIAQINNQTIYSAIDSAPQPPAGRYNELSVGSKTGAAAAGMVGVFDDVSIRVPSPF